MVAYSFQARFAEPILSGVKGGTIRSDRRRHTRPGEEMQLYTGMRTKHCRLIARKQCLAVVPIELNFSASQVLRNGEVFWDPGILDALARFDGFADFGEMTVFWGYRPRFEGWHVCWLPWQPPL